MQFFLATLSTASTSKMQVFARCAPHFENIKQCNFSGAPFTNPEVRLHSCDDLSTLHRFIACIKIARVHGGWSFDNNFDERAWRPTSNVSNTQANSFADGCCAQPRPDGLGRFSQNFPTRHISQHIPTKFPRARSSIIAMRDDVTVEFVNSKFSEQVFGECFQHYFNFFSSADGLNCMFQISTVSWWLAAARLTVICFQVFQSSHVGRIVRRNQ